MAPVLLLHASRTMPRLLPLPRRPLVAGLVFVGLLAPAAAPEAVPATRAPQSHVVFGADSDTPPYEYLDRDGQPQGFNIELMRALGRVAGVQVSFRLARWSTVLAELDGGRVDMMAMGYSDARSQDYDFVGETWTLHQVISFRGGRRWYPRSYRDLAGEVVALMDRGKIHDLLLELPPEQRPRLLLVPNVDVALRALLDGRATAAGGNVGTVRHVAARHGVRDLVDVTAHSVPYLLAVPKGRAGDFAWVGRALGSLKESGEFARLVEERLALPPPPPPPPDWRDSLRPVAGALTALGVLAAAVAFWNGALRRKVAARTAELASTLTEKDRLSEAITASEQRYRQLVDSLHAIVWRSDLRMNRFSFVSRQAEAILGYPLSHWKEPGFFATHLHPDDVLEAAAPCVDDQDGCRHEHEYRMIAADGRTVWFRGAVHVVCENGGPPELIGVMVDLTERKRLEAQLRQAQKMEAVGRLAGGVAHDFNNVLTAINGYTELSLRRLTPGDGLRDKLENIGKAAGRATALIGQLLAFSRQQLLSPKVLDLNEVVAGIEGMLRRVIGEDVRLTTRLQSPLGAVKADPSQLEQVVMNLAVNARDAMPNGGTLTIETADAGGEVMLEVRDTGTGMDAEVRSHIFEPFFTTKARGKGTGLGLATVYGIVEQSGGRITVDTAPGEGTAFRIYLPQVEEAPHADEREEGAAQVAAGTETVLLVEDDEPVRALIREVLESGGYHVLEARHAGEALLIAERHAGAIHLLLTDVVMPHMGGRELAERVVPLRRDIKVLFVSGYTSDLKLRGEIQQDGRGFLGKPFAPQELARKVRETLDA